MAFYKQYEGSFVAVNGCIWYVELWHEAQSAYTTVGELQFPASEPLTIEWDSDKRDTIVGSTATLNIISPGDRTYIDLYTVSAGSVFMKVYRKKVNGAKHLFWVGSLDTEFYEEPFSREKDYDVSLTFSDFGLLHRIYFDVANAERIEHIDDIVETCVRQATGGYISSSNIVVQCSTTVLGESVYESIYGRVGIRSDNFIDEDGEASTLYDVLEGILKPLALRIEQRCGRIFVYDFNAIATADNLQLIRWSGTDQRLAIDETANKITVNFSPYGDSQLMDGEIKDVTIGGDDKIIDSMHGSADGYQSFKFRYANITGTNIPAQLQTINAPLVKITPIEDGQDMTVVAGRIASYPDLVQYQEDDWDYSTYVDKLHAPSNTKSVIYKTAEIFVPKAQSLRVTIPMLLDSRYNPFVDEDTTYNRQNGAIKSKANAIFINCRIKCGNYYLCNNPATQPPSAYNQGTSAGTWQLAPSTLPTTWSSNANAYIYTLAYYNLDGLVTADGDSPCLGGMTPNRQPWGNKLKVTQLMSMLGDGAVIPAPPESGELTIELFDDVLIMDAGDGYNAANVQSTPYQKVRWWLIGLPTIEFVDVNGSNVDKHECQDVEQSGIINPLAKESFSIDTICGIIDDGSARGAFYRRVNNAWQLLHQQYCGRGNRNTSLEQLLIGTMYSQYAGRHLKLTGTADIPDYNDSEYSIFAEACYSDKSFICVSEVCNCIADESEVTLVELSADSYTAV